MPRFLISAILSIGLLIAQRTPNGLPTTDERIRRIELRLRKAPKNSSILIELAEEYLQKMRETADGAYLERARKIVKTVVDSEPGNYEARRCLVEIEMQYHRFAQVITTASALIRERAEDSIVWGLLGDALMETGNYHAAADAYQKMADLRPSLASYNRVAFYRFVTGDAQGAMAIMRQAILIGSAMPENVAWCLAELGDMLYKTGSVEDSQRAYLDALTIFPDYHRALAGMGRTLAARDHVPQAVEAFRKAQSIAPLPEYAGWLVRLYRRLGEFDLARKQLAMLDVADTLGKAAGESANRSLALAFADLDYKTPRALELAQAELAIRKDVYTYDALAWALFKNGKYPEAASAMDQALSQSTPEPSFHEHAARIFSVVSPKDIHKHIASRAEWR